ncbi:unnamed protein product, partial [Staurois parvus]
LEELGSEWQQCCQYKAVCLKWKAQTHSTQLTLWSPQMLTPSCPVPLVQYQCFSLALITVLVSLGMSVTPNQFPPVSNCPPQSLYKSLIAASTSKKNKIPVYILPFVYAITFT